MLEGLIAMILSLSDEVATSLHNKKWLCGYGEMLDTYGRETEVVLASDMDKQWQAA